MAVGKTRVTEVIDFAMLHGDEEAAKTFGISMIAIDRYRRKYKELYGENADLLMALKKQLTTAELKAMLSGSRNRPHDVKGTTVAIDGEKLIIGVMSDTHVGHVEFNKNYLYTAFDTMEARGCSMILHAGDVTEGLMNRPGHFFECSQYGYKAQRDEAVHVFSYWKKPIYMVSGNHDCLTPEAECLTDSGWKPYTALSLKDKVYSLNTETGKGEWHPITEIIIRDHEGDMVDIESNTLNISMTPNHRVLCSYPAYGTKIKYETRYGAYKYVEAQKLLDTTVGVYKMAADGDREEYPITDALLKAVAWIITDGSVKVTGNNISYTIWQSKDISRICNILDEAGLGYKVHTRTRNITHICGKKLKKPPLPENRMDITAEGGQILKKYLTSKTVPEWMQHISKRQFGLVSAEIKLANGSYNKKSKGWALYGTKEELDKFQILYIINGQRATLRQDTRGAWKLNICDASFIELRTGHIKQGVYTGKVWCIQTPLTNFMVRYRGSAVFTGNCSYNSKLGVGIDVVEDICDRLPNAEYLPGDPADIVIAGIRFRLFHGRDRGGSYAKSYRPQKILDSFGTDLPDILIVGHSHTSDFCKYKGCYIVDAGSIQRETDFMRGNKLQADVGFWVLEITIRNDRIVAISPTWYDLEEAMHG